MVTIVNKEILNSSVSERTPLVEDVKDSTREVTEAVKLTDEVKSELGRRLQAYRKDPVIGSPCEIVAEMYFKR